MADLYEQVTSDQDPFRKLASKIPGFAGYIERENRRAADKLVRETIVNHFEAIWKRIGNLQKDLAASQELEYVDDLEGAATKLRTFIDKVTTAAYGYSGFFDAVKINQDEIFKLYNYDLVLLEKADETSRAVDNAEKSVGTDGMPAAVRNMVALSRELVTAFDEREVVITATQ